MVGIGPLSRFSLTRRYAAVSLLGLVAASLLMAYVFSRHNLAILQTSAETQNVATTRLMGNLVFEKYERFVSQASGMNGDTLRSHPTMAELREAIASLARETNIAKVKIYDLAGRIVFSSSPQQIGQEQASNPGFVSATRGQVASELTFRGSFDAFEGTLEDRNLLSSYVPVRDAAGAIIAVFEVYSDVSEMVRQMEDARLKVIVFVGLPMFGLFVVLLLFVRKADRIIREQRVVLEDAKTHLETEVAARTRDLSTANDRFRRLLEIHLRMSKELDLDVLVPIAMEEIGRYVGADRGSLFLLDWKNMALSTKYAQGTAGEKISIPLKMGIVGTAILNRKTYNVSNAYEHPFFNPTLDQVLNFRTESILVVPIVDNSGHGIGGLQLLNSATGRFSPQDEQFAEGIATGLAVAIASSDEAAAGQAAKALHDAIRCDRVTVFRLDAVAGQLVSLYAEGVDRGQIALGMRLGIAGLVAVTGDEVIIDDASCDRRFDNRHDIASGYVTRSMMCLPIRARKGEVLGVAEVINKSGGPFDAHDAEILRSLIGVFSVFIENAMLFEDQDVQFHSLLEVMAASIDAKDTLTAGHSKRVAEIARDIGRVLGFTDRELEVLMVAALLHDYGKIGVSDAVLKKEGKLTDAEYAHIKHHARMTYDILDKTHFARKYRAVPMIAASHHEYLDGSGYPQGLESKQIPFMSKILTVADVYEALTADRHYRKGMSRQQAFAILQEGIGTRFDGNIVAALDQALGAH